MSSQWSVWSTPDFSGFQPRSRFCQCKQCVVLNKLINNLQNWNRIHKTLANFFHLQPPQILQEEQVSSKSYLIYIPSIHLNNLSFYHISADKYLSSVLHTCTTHQTFTIDHSQMYHVIHIQLQLENSFFPPQMIVKR